MFARKGERIMDPETGQSICEFARDVEHGEPISVDAFTNFADGEKPWVSGQHMDRRCFRSDPIVGNAIFVEGKWRS